MGDRQMEKGYIQVYTGDGKGKTTAAFGLAMRAAGAGLTVYIGQFMKQGAYSELKAIARFAGQITIEQFGAGGFIRGEPKPADKEAARKGLAAIRSAMASGDFDIVIMEEGNVAQMTGLITEDDLLSVMDAKPGTVELLITGRGATPAVIEKADLVTEMKAVKHYYEAGVAARTGIES